MADDVLLNKAASIERCAMLVGEYLSAHRETGVDRPEARGPRPSWRQGRGRGAVQGLAREHTSQGFVRKASPPRFACQALPDPATPTLWERSWTLGIKAASGTVPTAAARATPGEPDAFLVGDKALSRQVGVVGSGRAWGAKRGGNRGGCAESVRVLAHRAMNGSTASAWPPLRWNGGFQAVQQGQQRAGSCRFNRACKAGTCRSS